MIILPILTFGLENLDDCKRIVEEHKENWESGS